MSLAHELGVGGVELYDEKLGEVKLPSKNPGCGILIRMIGELQEELAKSTSLIVLSEDIRNRSAAGSVVAEILQIGDNAFNSPRFVYFNGAGLRDKYCVGDRVLIKRMSGTIIPGSKGTFQIIDDDAILSIY